MTVDGYTPSEAAVEVVAVALAKACPRTFSGSYAYPREVAVKALVAFMGATVPAEPCATCGDSGWVGVTEESNGMFSGVPCPDCPSPRSLPVVECEAAGLLEVSEGHWVIRSLPPTLFRAAAPSTGSPT